MPVVLAVLALLLVPGLLADERPLPDAAVVMREARKRLEFDSTRQSNYVYVETRRSRSLDGKGRITKESIKVFERYPGLPGETGWERLIQEDGKPLSEAKLAEQDRERQEHVQKYLRNLEGQDENDRRKLERKRQEERREEAQIIDDGFRIFEMTLRRREALEGHDTLVVDFKPRPNVKASTREGGLMKHFAGTAWVSESDYELVRLDVVALDTVSFGLGLFARIHEGSKLSFQRRKVNGEEWLPASMSLTASARLLLLKRMRVDQLSEFSGYRKFDVATDTTFATER
jgi:hypothetical protein